MNFKKLLSIGAVLLVAGVALAIQYGGLAGFLAVAVTVRLGWHQATHDNGYDVLAWPYAVVAVIAVVCAFMGPAYLVAAAFIAFAGAMLFSKGVVHIAQALC